MTTNLLNPACDTCYDCDGCPQCSDYYDPNYWYVWFENYANTPYASAGTAGGINSGSFFYNLEYYWDSSNLHTTINNLLASFQFPGTEPSTATGAYKRYTYPSISSFIATASADIYIRHKISESPDVWAAWQSRTVSFSNFRIYDGFIENSCVNGKRFHNATLRFDMSVPKTGGTTNLTYFPLYTNNNEYLCASLPMTAALFFQMRDTTATYNGIIPVEYNSIPINVPFPLKRNAGGFYEGASLMDTTSP